MASVPRHSPLSLAGKVSLITGGSRCIAADTVGVLQARPAPQSTSTIPCPPAGRAGRRVVSPIARCNSRFAPLVQELYFAVNCRSLFPPVLYPSAPLFLCSPHVLFLRRILPSPPWRKPRGGRTFLSQSRQRLRPGAMPPVSAHMPLVILPPLLPHVVLSQLSLGHSVLVSSTTRGPRGEAVHSDYAVTSGAHHPHQSLSRANSRRDGIDVNCVARVVARRPAVSIQKCPPRLITLGSRQDFSPSRSSLFVPFRVSPSPPLPLHPLLLLHHLFLFSQLFQRCLLVWSGYGDDNMKRRLPLPSSFVALPPQPLPFTLRTNTGTLPHMH